MSDILTTEEVLDDVWRKIHKKYPNSLWTKSAEQAMIEFAKMHVKEALRAAQKKAIVKEGNWPQEDAHIVYIPYNVYPLENIK